MSILDMALVSIILTVGHMNLSLSRCLEHMIGHVQGQESSHGLKPTGLGSSGAAKPSGSNYTYTGVSTNQGSFPWVSLQAEPCYLGSIEALPFGNSHIEALGPKCYAYNGSLSAYTIIRYLDPQGNIVELSRHRT